MMATLTTAYSDTRAEDLTWCLGQDPLPALAVLDLDLADTTVQLRLLGASHQVLVDGPAGRCSETVACLPGAKSPLPALVAERADGWEYEFSALVERPTEAGFAARAQELVALAREHPSALVGTFPGHPHAFTALLVEAEPGTAALRWRTWHAYPQEARLVCTRTRMFPALVMAA
ncbi:hypothetical protein BIV57_15555 [Mangrovactinospora gilvigrisea]|uniref:DUF2617 domain-containing protein n=1 Tax=Mangrovactinospora gilvigrisea TaxID=1428644 RepID=A0A1J7CA96_9ACTN|nr:DUF2617 family protein [Mangrovactinospora gilvigrisea]OIV36570.1 hypothetical protein BIV57_15555 [Mangrovactinospora gilvigrisea]